MRVDTAQGAAEADRGGAGCDGGGRRERHVGPALVSTVPSTVAVGLRLREGGDRRGAAEGGAGA
jgi:hypothetical protein